VRIPALVSVRYCAIEKVCMCSAIEIGQGIAAPAKWPDARLSRRFLFAIGIR
jgi:hypothetical protein